MDATGLAFSGVVPQAELLACGAQRSRGLVGLYRAERRWPSRRLAEIS